MNGEHYEEWFKNVLTLVPYNKSVIVLDQAPYHKLRVSGTFMPKMFWRKFDMIEWMKKNKVPLPELVTEFLDMTKASLIKLSKKYPRRNAM